MSEAPSLAGTIDGTTPTVHQRTRQEIIDEYAELNVPHFSSLNDVPAYVIFQHRYYYRGDFPFVTDDDIHNDILRDIEPARLAARKHERIAAHEAQHRALVAAHEAQHRALFDQESDRSPPRPPSHTTTTLETYKSPQRLSSHTTTSSSPTPSRTMTTPETYRSPHRLSSHTMTSSSSPRRASTGAVQTTTTPRSRPFNVRITLHQRDQQARERSQLLRRERQLRRPHSRPRSSTPRSSFQQAAITSSTRTFFRPVP